MTTTKEDLNRWSRTLDEYEAHLVLLAKKLDSGDLSGLDEFDFIPPKDLGEAPKELLDRFKELVELQNAVLSTLEKMAEKTKESIDHLAKTRHTKKPVKTTMLDEKI